MTGTKSRPEEIRDAIDSGGGQCCDIEGVIRVLNERGFAILSAGDIERIVADLIRAEWKAVVDYKEPDAAAVFVNPVLPEDVFPGMCPCGNRKLEHCDGAYATCER